MSIIRATRQKGGYSSDHKATSYGGVTDEPAFKPKGSRSSNNSYHGKIKDIRKGFSTIRASFCLPFFYAP